MELLVGDKFLSLDDDPLIQAIWPVPHLDRAMALDLGERITCKLKPYPAPDDAIKLSEALRGCPADDKPWCLIVEALLAGHISLYYTGKGKLDFRSCLMSRQDAKAIHSLRAANGCRSTRSVWLKEADARERLSIGWARLRSHVDAERLSKARSLLGLTYRRSEIDAVAIAWVSTLELQTKLGLTKWELPKVRHAAGLMLTSAG